MLKSCVFFAVRTEPNISQTNFRLQGLNGKKHISPQICTFSFCSHTAHNNLGYVSREQQYWRFSQHVEIR
jgi:hypothetical protein